MTRTRAAKLALLILIISVLAACAPAAVEIRFERHPVRDDGTNNCVPDPRHSGQQITGLEAEMAAIVREFRGDNDRSACSSPASTATVSAFTSRATSGRTITCASDRFRRCSSASSSCVGEGIGHNGHIIARAPQA